MNKKIDKHYENLAKLYLRLKGYFITNLILHSNKKGELLSEIDILAIRMPLHKQIEREVNVDDYLECSDNKIEILIADVKNVKSINSVEFNKGIRRNDKAIKQLINWVGVFEEEENLITKVENHLNIHSDFGKGLKGFAQFDYKNEFGNFNFKFTFFCPSLEEWNGENFKYIHGQEMVEFVWKCLNIQDEPEECNRIYNYENWNELKKYVVFFKKQNTPVTIQEFEDEFKNFPINS